MELGLGEQSREHKCRGEINANRAKASLEDWALEVAPASVGMSVMDIGCGRGKLVFPYSQAVGAEGSVLGMDHFADAIEEVKAQAASEGRTNVDGCVGDLNTVVADMGQQRFDLIVSSYAIYYADDVVALLKGLRGLLNEGGRVFVCGYGRDTNIEIDDLARSVAPAGVEVQPTLPDFLSASQVAEIAEVYNSGEIFRLPNQVRFGDADSLLGWWTNHGSFVPEALEAVKPAVAKHFEENDEFILTKNVLGVLFCA